jgi:heat-inducible transcriptional repressor
MSRIIPDLNSRSREILRKIIDAYLETGEAVGSHTLTKRLGLELSPATVRNVMSDLQDAGLLYSPHVSSGRLPTEAGLRFFVDGLLEVGRLTEHERSSIESQCAAQGRNSQKTLEEASRVLSGLSNYASLVVVPKADARLKHIEFVAFGPDRALVILVTDDGAVENRVIDIPVGMPASIIVEATNFLSARMVGKTLEEGQNQIAAELLVHRQELGVLTQRLVEAGMATSAGYQSGAVLIVSGT